MDREHFNETYSVSCLIGLHPSKNIFLTGRQESNDQVDFIKFLISAINRSFLQSGDILVCDNARIHGAEQTYGSLQILLDAAQIELIYLPAYSPELNPIELVFGKVKRFLREYRDRDLPLWIDIGKAFSTITYKNIFNFYYKCLQ